MTLLKKEKHKRILMLCLAFALAAVAAVICVQFRYQNRMERFYRRNRDMFAAAEEYVESVYSDNSRISFRDGYIEVDSVGGKLRDEKLTEMMDKIRTAGKCDEETFCMYYRNHGSGLKEMHIVAKREASDKKDGAGFALYDSYEWVYLTKEKGEADRLGYAKLPYFKEAGDGWYVIRGMNTAG